MKETRDLPGALPAVAPGVLTGTVGLLGSKAVPSGIDKHPAPGPWQVGLIGLIGDEQADRRHHGGPEKALHHYPFDHYATWRATIGHGQILQYPGAFGENISTTGWTEDLVHIGDVVRFGSVLLQVSQARQPCWKLDLRFGTVGFARRMQTTGMTGWYYRILEPGRVEPGSLLTLTHRPQPDWPLARVLRLLYRDIASFRELREMAALPELSDSWRSLASQRIVSRRVEDWSDRLRDPHDETRDMHAERNGAEESASSQ